MVFCVVEKAKATATFGMPVSTSQYSQYLQIVLISIRQKKKEVIQHQHKEEKLDVPPFLILIHHERV